MLDLFLVIQGGGIRPETTVHAVLESRDLRDENKSFGTIQSWVVQGVAVLPAISGNFSLVHRVFLRYMNSLWGRDC